MFQVIKQTEEFERSLKDMQFLQRDSTDLLKYARDVNCHFASKKCKDVIVAARKLMTSKMHNTVKVCEPSGFFSCSPRADPVTVWALKVSFLLLDHPGLQAAPS